MAAVARAPRPRVTTAESSSTIAPAVSLQISSAVVRRCTAGFAGFVNCDGMKTFGGPPSSRTSSSSSSSDVVRSVRTSTGAPFTTASVQVALDVNNNGINDDWEVQYFGGIGVNPNADTDGDGFTNLQEFLTGTDPTNSASAFRITSIVTTGNSIRVTWMMGPGKTNALERATGDGGLYTTNFVTIFTVTNTVGTTTNYLDVGAATTLEEIGISAEVINLRTLRPLDIDTIVESVKKTGRIVTVEEGWPQGGIGAEIAAQVMEKAFDYLDAPVTRVTGKDVPMPYAANLEKLALPSADEVIAAVNAVTYRS